MLKYGHWSPMPRYLMRRHAVSNLLKEVDFHGKKVLEIGHGAGAMLVFFSRKGAQVEGWDFSPEARRMAKDLSLKQDRGCCIRIYSNENEIGNDYDYIILFEVLEHIIDDKSYLSGIVARLKQNGRIIMSFPAHMSRWNTSDVKVGHCRRYSKQGVNDLCAMVGLKKPNILNYGFPLTAVLDPILNWSYKEKKDTYRSKDELSRDSGVETDSSLAVRIFSRDLFLWPFYILQRFFWKTDLGSCYLVIAEKQE